MPLPAAQAKSSTAGMTMAQPTRDALLLMAIPHHGPGESFHSTLRGRTGSPRSVPRRHLLFCSLSRGDVWVERGQNNGYTRKESRDTQPTISPRGSRAHDFFRANIVSSPGFRLRLIGGLLGCKGLSLMKKGGILNPAICSLLAELGQSDELLIVDAAYPLPTDGHVIDLTLTQGIPRLLDVVRAVADELVIESIAVPVEMKEYSPRLYQELVKILGDIDVDEVPFHEFKEQSLDVKGIIRTAEFSSYANVRIVAGSAF